MNCKNMNMICAIAAALAASASLAAGDPADEVVKKPPTWPRARLPIVAPAPEFPTISGLSNVGVATKSAFTASSAPSPDSTTLSPPLTLNYSGSSPTLLINNSGTNKGVESLISNSSNSTSAIYGSTNGSGAGLTGYNSGTVGPAGKFGVLNSNSQQPGALATTTGTGPAVFGMITNGSSYSPAILGESASASGVGVEGYAEGTGVEAIALGETGIGIYAYSQAYWGGYISSDASFGLFAESHSNYAIYAASFSGSAMYALAQTTGNGIDVLVSSGQGINAQSSSGTALLGHATTGTGLDIASDSGVAIDARSTNSYAIRGHDFGGGVGVYGTSATGYAGYFDGTVAATSFKQLSDRNAKTQIQAVDGKAILGKIANLPISAWVFKSDLQRNHVGPMAQDFHATFGLDGNDDTHINLTDVVGVSLAGIQELGNEMQQQEARLAVKDSEIAALKLQLSAQTDVIVHMKSLSEQVAARLTLLEQQQRTVGAQTVALRRKPVL